MEVRWVTCNEHKWKDYEPNPNVVYDNKTIEKIPAVDDDRG
jgi:hypothetical protein